MNLKKCIDTAKEYLGKAYYSNLTIAYLPSDDLNLLKVIRNGMEVSIEYGRLSSLFRGLTLIKERSSETQYEVTFHQKFDTNGLMLDCSRNGVMKNEKVKEMILISALMGHNRLLLYTEDTYELDKYPYFGYLRGGYSKEDIKEFVAYGESFGVELIPCIQTLGHLYHALKWSPLSELKDGEDSMMVDLPKTYEFIEDILKFCRECFKSTDIHIGMDESFEMGLRRYIGKFGYQNRVEMFSRHLRKLIEMCKKYDFVPMIWSDMYFRLNSPTEDYYIDKPLPDETVRLIPPEVKLVYWDYYHPHKQDYLNMIKYHKQASNTVVFAGGSWRWIGFTPEIRLSIEYTKSALEACYEEGIKDVFTTAWGDDGNECSFFTILPVLAEASVMNYSEYNSNDIDSLVRAISGDGVEDFLALDLPNMLIENNDVAHYNPSKYLFYQDVLLGMFDFHVKDCFSRKYAKFAGILAEKAQKSEKYGYMYLNLSNLCKVLSIKVDLGVRIRKAYKQKDLNALRSIVKEIDNLLVELDKFHVSLEEQWLKECRVFGFEVLDGRIGFLRNRIVFAKERILEYLDGKIDKIEELEKEILPFDGKEENIIWCNWLRATSPCN